MMNVDRVHVNYVERSFVQVAMWPREFLREVIQFKRERATKEFSI